MVKSSFLKRLFLYTVVVYNIYNKLISSLKKGGEDMFHKECKFWSCANHVGLFFVALFALCFLWYFVHPYEQELHMAMFKISFFSFTGMNFLSFVLAAIQAYIWGYIVVGVWQLLGYCCKSCKKC